MDEIANAAFFVGLLQSLPKTYGEISRRLSFTDAKANFFRAARHGLNAQFTWVDGTTHAAVPLILNELLPQAREGLKGAGVDSSDVDYYLGIIEERVRSGQTGAQWMVRSLSAMEGTPEGPRSKDLRHRILTATIRARQREGEPVHRWPLIKVNDTDDWTKSYQTVGQFMSTDLFTVRPDDLIDLAASVMDWRHIRHVPVEDEQGRLVGLVTHRSLLRLLSRGGRTTNPTGSPILVRDIMKTDPVTVESTTSTLKAIEIMRTAKLGCLPVVDQGELVGIVTSFDFLEASARLFKKSLSASAQSKSLIAHN
jgi:CBS domain-containing protein